MHIFRSHTKGKVHDHLHDEFSTIEAHIIHFCIIWLCWAWRIQNIYLLNFKKKYIFKINGVRLKFCQVLLAQLSILLAPRHKAVRYVEPWYPSHKHYFDQIRNSIKMWNALFSNMLNQSQQNFAHVMTMQLSWCEQNFVVISWVYLKPEHCKFWSNFELDQNIISGTGTCPAQ